jgi:phage tail sheath protein FI
MTDFVGNSLVLTIFQKVDKPTNRRLIDTIVDTTNIWLNGLVSSGSALGARVEFRHDENPDTEMINGHYIFHVYEFFPLPAEWIEFRLELDISYLSVLFSQTATVAA